MKKVQSRSKSSKERQTRPRHEVQFKGESTNKSKDKNETAPIERNSIISKGKYRIAKYQQVSLKSEEPKEKPVLEVEGIVLSSRGLSGNRTYFECSSARLRNAPGCFFRGRIVDYDVSNCEGSIEIIKEHSKSCKFIIGNESKEIKTNTLLSLNKINYKTMKIEIEKKLEDENWPTPKEVLDWIKKSFEIANHLTYNQVEEIVTSWRKKNSVIKDQYIFQNTLNKKGLPFLRTYFTLFYKKNNINKSLKLVIWSSDFQLNRIRLSDHWYCDGTFGVVPSQYNQLFTIAIKDPNTGFVRPAMWALLNTKDEEAYYHLFKVIKDIVSVNNSINWNLSSITLDFEVGLHNGFKAHFSETRIFWLPIPF